jgi:hypothetical protein
MLCLMNSIGNSLKLYNFCKAKYDYLFLGFDLGLVDSPIHDWPDAR